jgi:hypothetical protein
MLELWEGTRKSDKKFSYSLEYASNQPTHWLVLCWSTFGAKTSHWRLRIHKTHHGPGSGEATTFPYIVYFAAFHESYIQMAFCLKTPKGESRNCQGWNSCGVIISRLDLRLRRGLKQSCSFRQKLSNGVLYATCMHRSRVDSRLFMVGSQTRESNCQFDSRHFFLP